MFADLTIGDLAPLVIIVVAVVYNLGRKLLGLDKEQEQKKQKAPANQQKQAAPAQQETKLPYEDLVDGMLGPYIAARKRKHEARKNPVPVAGKVQKSSAPESDVVSIKEPAPPAVIEAVPVKSDELSLSKRRKRTLDEIIFQNPRFSPGARLVLASEILNRPRALRNR